MGSRINGRKLAAGVVERVYRTTFSRAKEGGKVAQLRSFITSTFQRIFLVVCTESKIMDWAGQKIQMI
jgi:hypothetical protein